MIGARCHAYRGVEIHRMSRGSGKRRRGAEIPNSVTNERGRPRVLAIFLGGKSLPQPSSLRVQTGFGVVSGRGMGCALYIASACIAPHLTTLAPGSLRENNERWSKKIAVTPTTGANPMDLGLHDKPAIVTGGSQGIGTAP